MKIKAYAKLNLILNIKGTLPNGYHNIETLMHLIDLYDDVDVNVSDGSGISLSILNSDVSSGEDNLAYKAALEMKKVFDKECHVDIVIDKNIPAAGGLGGGSADCAAVIVCLAKLWNTDDLEKEMQAGAKLGSDVPFFVGAYNGHPAAICTGTGTDVEFVDQIKFDYDLKISDISIADKTKRVYAELKESDCVPVYDIKAFLNAPAEKRNELIGNHLEAPALRVFKSEGIDLKLDGYHISGAGPTLFRLK